MAVDPSQIPVQATPLERPLVHLADRLRAGGPVKVVAIGSSTTAGEGGIAPYPQRLLADLRNHFRGPFPTAAIDVINRGVGGEEAPLELERFDNDVFRLNPDLVIWQVGTNSVWQPADQNPPSYAETTQAIRDGVDRLLGTGRIDVILMDLQYVPALLTPAKTDATNAMVKAISDIAHEKGVNVFRRFELMQDWHKIAGISFDRLVDPGDQYRLHASDWTTDQMSEELARLINTAVNQAPPTAGSRS